MIQPVSILGTISKGSEVIFDIEADGLLDTITKVHCLSFRTVDGSVKGSFTNYDDIRTFISSDFVFIGHYIVGYDFKALAKILGCKKPPNLVDTLGMAWYLEPERSEYGLESYGDEFGVPKPYIGDWENLSTEDYLNRCETDTEINRILWNRLKKKLVEIYS